MKIGYPCINLSLKCRSSRTFRLASYSEERFMNTVSENLDCLEELLRFNVDKGLLFFRITSDLIPFASHPVCRVPWQKVFQKRFQQIGSFIRRHGIRVSMHPDQFVLINSPDTGIFRRSVAELLYHADVLDLLGADRSARIQIHVGGAYGDKPKSIRRFIRRYRKLQEKITRRLVIENDERMYTVSDCIDVNRETHIPVVFDTLHFTCNSGGQSLKAAFDETYSTWTAEDGLPIVDYSSQDSTKKRGSHAASISSRDFRRFLTVTDGLDFDIMLEIKDKERSAQKALEILSNTNRTP